MSQPEKDAYRALVGQLNWVATHTRPDVAFETCELSVTYNKATMADLLKLNKLVERVKMECVNLFFPRLQPLPLRLVSLNVSQILPLETFLMKDHKED